MTILLTVLSVAAGVYVTYYDLGQLVPEASDRAVDIDNLFKFMAVFGNAIMIYVTGYIIYFSVVFRRKASDPPDAIGVQIHDAPTLEIWWTVIPVILLTVLSVLSIQVWYKIQYGTGATGLTAEVIAHQFGYEFRYPGVANPVLDELHLPLGEPVHLDITSQDVLHSFWVPDIRLKADTVPGLVQNLNFTPTRAGTYLIECTEFCGVGHSKMVGTLVIESPQKFAAYIEQQKKSQAAAASAPAAPAVNLAQGNAAAGKALFETKCTACHALAPFAHKVVGPGLGHLMTDKAHPKLVNGQPVSPANIAGIITHGYNGGANGVMPTAQLNGLSPKDIANLTAFLTSLK
ncbi:MAG: cytochrome c oxidase subunit II [Vulcanimicrobiaceae bacterium]